MANALNKLQGERLLSIMVQNQSVAFGYHISIKNKYEKCWNFIEDELNSLGPPFKSLAEWKKTWSDQKRYILKRKNSANLTPIEMAVYRMFTDGSRRHSNATTSHHPVQANTSSSITSAIATTERLTQNNNNNKNNSHNNNENCLTNLKMCGNKMPTKRIKLEVEENDTVAYDNNLYNITVLNEAEVSDNDPESIHNDDKDDIGVQQQQTDVAAVAETDAVDLGLPHRYYKNLARINTQQRRQLQYYNQHHHHQHNDNDDSNDNYHDNDDLYGVEDIERNEFLSLDEAIYQNHFNQSNNNSTNNSNNNSNNNNNNNNNNDSTNSKMDVNYMRHQENANKNGINEMDMAPLPLPTTSRPTSVMKMPTKLPEHNCCIGHDVSHTLKGINNHLEKLYTLEVNKLREMKRHNRIIESLRRQEIHFKSFKRKLKKE